MKGQKQVRCMFLATHSLICIVAFSRLHVLLCDEYVHVFYHMMGALSPSHNVARHMPIGQ